MRNPFKDDIDRALDSQIQKVLDEMDIYGVSEPEYPTKLSYLERLHDIRSKARPEKVSRDTVAAVLGNLAGILLIVAYEQKHVLTSKAIGQIGRIKT